MKSRHTEEQIIQALKEALAGPSVINRDAEGLNQRFLNCWGSCLVWKYGRTLPSQQNSMAFAHFIGFDIDTEYVKIADATWMNGLFETVYHHAYYHCNRGRWGFSSAAD